MLAHQELHHPNAILALPSSPFTAAVAERLRQGGWRVDVASSCARLHRLASRTSPDVVVLATEGFDESGWLTCAKLLKTAPRLRVILVGDVPEEGGDYVQFVGAEALLPAETSVDDLIERIEGAVAISH